VLPAEHVLFWNLVFERWERKRSYPTLQSSGILIAKNCNKVSKCSLQKVSWPYVLELSHPEKLWSDTHGKMVVKPHGASVA